MAFLFKSKKHPEKAPASREAGSGSQGSIQSASARVAEKNAVQHRATPTGSLHSLENEGSNGSPDHGPGHGHGRRGGSADQPVQTGEVPVSCPRIVDRPFNHLGVSTAANLICNSATALQQTVLTRPCIPGRNGD